MALPAVSCPKSGHGKENNKQKEKEMGNRAVVTFSNMNGIEKHIVRESDGKAFNLKGFVEANPDKVGVYLHWNGGNDSITAFCEVCKRLKFRGPASDCYGVARFVQVVANFFGQDGLSVGVDTLSRLDCDNWDNGVYVVNDTWEIIGREFHDGAEQAEYDVDGMVNEILSGYEPHDA